METLLRIEENILMFIQENLRYDWLSVIFKSITFLADKGWFWILLSLVMLIIRPTRRTGMIMCMSASLNILLVNVTIKPLVARTRPYILFDSLISLVGNESDYSFPSGHSAISFAVAMVLLLCLPKKFGIPAVVLAFLIAISRLYVGVHYPTDVICGIIIGTACAFIAKFVFEKIEKKWSFIDKLKKL